MRAKCVICEKPWNISIHRTIGKNGYICPVCQEKRDGFPELIRYRAKVTKKRLEDDF